MEGIAMSDACLTKTRWDTLVLEENIVLCLFGKNSFDFRYFFLKIFYLKIYK